MIKQYSSGFNSHEGKSKRWTFSKNGFTLSGSAKGEGEDSPSERFRGMEMRRFFWQDKAGIGEIGTIDGADSRHILTVLRMKPGDRLVVLDGIGNDFEAEIEAISPDEVKVTPVKRIQITHGFSCKDHLCPGHVER